MSLGYYATVYIPNNELDKSTNPGGGDVLLGILGGDVSPGSSNPDPISDL